MSQNPDEQVTYVVSLTVNLCKFGRFDHGDQFVSRFLRFSEGCRFDAAEAVPTGKLCCPGHLLSLHCALFAVIKHRLVHTVN